MLSDPGVSILRKAPGLRQQQISRLFLPWRLSPEQTWQKVRVSMTPGLRLQQRPTHSPDHHRRIVWRTEYHQDDIRVQQSVPLIQQFCIRIAKTPVVPEGIKTDQSISTFVIVRGLIKLTTGIGRS